MRHSRATSRCRRRRRQRRWRRRRRNADESVIFGEETTMSVAALVVCVLLQPNAAPPASERDAVRQLVAKVIESHGGRECLAKRKCYYWRGEGTLWNGT